jgi:hypothetical protein
VYGGALSWDYYNGETDFDALSEFAKKHISKPICAAYKEEYCEGEELELILKLKSMPDDEFMEMVTKAQEEMAVIGEAFEEKRQEVWAQHEEVADEFNEIVDQIVEKSNMKFITAILAKRGKGAVDEEEGDTDGKDEL